MGREKGGRVSPSLSSFPSHPARRWREIVRDDWGQVWWEEGELYLIQSRLLWQLVIGNLALGVCAYRTIQWFVEWPQNNKFQCPITNAQSNPYWISYIRDLMSASSTRFPKTVRGARTSGLLEMSENREWGMLGDNREIKFHVYAEWQTWICITWPSFPLIFRLLLIASLQK